MKHSKKKALLLPLLLCPMLFSCGQEEDIKIIWWTKFTKPLNVLDETTREDPIYSSWWAIQDIIKGFHALHENIHVEQVSYANDPAIAAAIDSALKHPDLLPNMASTYGTYAVKWKEDLIDVTAKGKALEEDDDFIQSILTAEAQQYGGEKYYSLPFSKSGEAIVYNVDTWDEEKPLPQTFFGLMERARLIKKNHPEIYGDDVQRNENGKLNACPVIYKDAGNLFFTACESFGAPVVAAEESIDKAILFNNDKAKTVVKELKKWANEGLITTKKHTAKDLVEIFNEGKAEYVITSTANVPDMVSEETLLRFKAIPSWNGATPRKVISQGPSVCFFKKSPAQDEAALLFYDYLINGDNTAAFSKSSGYLPLRAGAYTMPDIAREVYASKFKGAKKDSSLAEKELAYMGDVLLVNDQYDKEHNYFMSPVCAWSGDIRTQVESIIVNVFNDRAAITDEQIDALVESEFTRAAYSI